MKSSKFNTFRGQITKLLIITSFIPILLVSLGSFYSVRNTVKKDFSNLMEANVNTISTSIIDSFFRNENNLKFLSEEPNAKGTLENANDEITWINKTLDNYVAANKDILFAYILLENNKFISSPSVDIDPLSLKDENWYKNAMASPDKVTLTDAYFDSSTNKPVITYSKAIKDKNNKIIGVMCLDINLDSIVEVVNDCKVDYNSTTTVLSLDGTIVADKDSSIMGKNKDDLPWISDVLNYDKRSSNMIEIDGENLLMFTKLEKDTNLLIVSFTPYNEVIKAVFSSLTLPFIIFIVTVIVIFIISKIFSSKISTPIKDVTLILDKIKDGDFTEKATLKSNYTSELKSIVNSVNSLVDDMVDILSSVKNSAGAVSEAADTLFVITNESTQVGEQVAEAISEIAQGATDQAADLNTSIDIVTNLGNEVNSSLENSKNMLISSGNVKKSTEEGLNTISLLKSNYEKNNEATQTVAEKVNLVAKNSAKIESITLAIKSITEQTNLLALNASIEAARAGEAGHGFAVVANEVRKLAEESAKFAGEISSVISENNTSIKDLYDHMKISSELNLKTGESVNITTNTFEEIATLIIDLESLINVVNNSLSEINNSKNKVVDNISNVSSVAQETAATSEEVSASSEEQASGLNEISRQAESLKSSADTMSTLIDKFKI